MNDKRLLIVSKRNNFQSMSKLIEAAKEGNMAKVLEWLPTSDINGADEVGDLSPSCVKFMVLSILHFLQWLNILLFVV